MKRFDTECGLKRELVVSDVSIIGNDVKRFKVMATDNERIAAYTYQEAHAAVSVFFGKHVIPSIQEACQKVMLDREQEPTEVAEASEKVSDLKLSTD